MFAYYVKYGTGHKVLNLSWVKLEDSLSYYTSQETIYYSNYAEKQITVICHVPWCIMYV